MIRRVFALLVIVAAVGTAACVSQSSDPSLSGPSGFATSLTVTATPDSINRDGSSQATVVVKAIDAKGQPLSGLSLHMDMGVGGVAQDFGTISQRNLVTDSNGRATLVYTAPPAPPAGATFSTTSVTIRATPVGTDAVANNSWASADIKLVPQGTILPPDNSPNGPVASFAFNPAAPTAAVPVTFDATASTGGPSGNSHQITSYSWNFGDGATDDGRVVTHTFGTARTYTVILTVVNDLGQAATKSVAVVVTNPTAPAPDFVFSPAAPVVGQDIDFNADTTTSAPNHRIVRYTWIFGDGTRATGLEVKHHFDTAGSYDVTLNVEDDAGQEATAKKTITVGNGSPTASFTSTTADSVTHKMNFDASGSTAIPSASITSYSWDFGDGNSGSGVVVQHAFASGNTYIVTLTVTDNTGKTGVKSSAVVVP